MTFKIPNEADAAFADQAEPDSVDFDILAAALDGDGVISGCAVSEQGVPDLTLQVAVGEVLIGSKTASVTAGNVTITAADPTDDRFDLVVVDDTGAKSVTAGTPSTNPVFPAIPANSIVLAAVVVPATDTAITNNQITDKRVFIRSASGSTTFLVAANDALQSSKDKADYLSDGTADEVQIQAAIDALPSGGGMVSLSEGTFTLAATINITASQNDTRLVGSGKGITILAGGGTVTAFNVKGTAEFSHITFDLCANAFILDKTAAGIVEKFTLDKCEFLDCDRVIFCEDDPSGAGVGVDLVRVSDCDFDGSNITDMKSQIQWEAPVNRLEFSGCRFTNLTSSELDFRAIRVGNNTFADQDTWRRIIVRYCYFNGLSHTNVSADSDLQAVAIDGREVIVTNNHFEDIQSDDDLDCEAVYFKARRVICSDNIFIDAGSDEGAITVKGRDRGDETGIQGFAIVITGNHIFFTSANTNTQAFESEAGNLLFANNYIEGCEEQGIKIASGDLSNISILNNTIFNTTGSADKARKAIFSESTGDDIIIKGNIIDIVDSGATTTPQGIRIAITSGKTPKNWDISENIISNIDTTVVSSENCGIFIKPSSVITDLRMVGNQIRSARNGMRFSNSAVDGLWMEGNKFASITTTEIDLATAPTNSHIDHNGPTWIDNGSSGSNITPEPLIHQLIMQTLTGNITVNAPVDPVKAMRLRIMLPQDATGGRTVAWNAVFVIRTEIDPDASAITSWYFVYDGANWVEQVKISEHSIAMGQAGTIPAATTNDTADFLVTVPFDMLLTRLKGVVKTKPTSDTTIQIRRSTDDGNSFSNAFGTVVITAAGTAKSFSADPADLAVDEGDVLNYSITVGGGDGSNLLVEAIGVAR